MLFLGLLALTGLVNSSTSKLDALIRLLNCTDFPPNTNQTVATLGANEKEKLDIRLPRSLKPLHYLIRLQPLINGNLSIFGYVEVEMEVLEPTSNITLHLADIITKNDTVKVSALNGTASVGIKKQQYDPEREFYIAHLEKQLEKAEKYVLSMDFLGILGVFKGFFKSTYTDIDGTTKNVAATIFQPTDARRAFPCFDEPALKATFEVHLARETWMTSLSNTPLAETRPVCFNNNREGQEGWVWDRFERSVPMSTYLVAFLVSDFTYIESWKDDQAQFRVWARRSAIENARYVASIGPKILNFYEDYFNISFPLRKQDMVALPDLSALALGNWGLTNSSKVKDMDANQRSIQQVLEEIKGNVGWMESNYDAIAEWLAEKGYSAGLVGF
ncbi:putative aminopeptidase N-like isoform X1 [Penaeus vannamei]|uniref:Putative aminopeptidase N-like isoform X1 n=1 Tax=Penaeus vannamei TaxID=6689 RepID=A0A3R7PHL1_PENVA|nr:putative aminopeptidase N-like isoform X1 [Penaeus vannamei]